MIAAAKSCGVNLFQANRTLKLIMTHGLHLDLFTLCFVNNVSIEKDKAVALKENRPPPFVLTNPGINLVHISRLIADVNQVYVIIV